MQSPAVRVGRPAVLGLNCALIEAVHMPGTLLTTVRSVVSLYRSGGDGWGRGPRLMLGPDELWYDVLSEL